MDSQDDVWKPRKELVVGKEYSLLVKVAENILCWILALGNPQVS